jgi:hypothetical protein
MESDFFFLIPTWGNVKSVHSLQCDPLTIADSLQMVSLPRTKTITEKFCMQGEVGGVV